MIQRVIRITLSIVLLPLGLYADGYVDADSAVVSRAERDRNNPPVVKAFSGLEVTDQVHFPRDPIVVDERLVADTTLEKRAHAHAVLQKVLDGQRFLESLDALSEVELPIGVVKAGGALDYTILIDRMEFSKEGALMDVYVSLALPQTGTRLAFHGRVPLSSEGGIGDNARVFLIGDHATKFSETTLLTIKGSQQSYVEFDCNGFLGVRLEASLQFSTDVLLPEDREGNVIADRLTINFSTYTQSLNDMLLSVTIPPFQVTGLDGFGFRATEAWLDWSDQSNPSGLTFPTNYNSPFLTAGMDNLWHGIYVRALQVRFPKAFTRSNKQKVEVGGEHLIIDDTGVTGSVYAQHIFQDGDMSGWTYTLDKAALQLTSNRISGFSFEGKLTIPVVKGSEGKDTQFKYVAQLGAEGNYVFAISIADQLRLDLWMADIRLANGSQVIVEVKDDRFYPSAHLNGELSINISSKGPKTSFNSIRFENMVINSEAPHFQPGTFGFGREGHHSSLSKYPVVFDNIGVKSEDNRVGIAFDAMVNIGGKPEDESFAGKARIVVWGIQDGDPKRDDNGKVIGIRQNGWKFDHVELSSVRINIKKPKVIELVGEVRFFNDDRIYGDGFKGKLTGKIQSIRVEAEALFGQTDSYRYWYADALVELKTGIPIVPGVLSAFGFGGGYYSKMKQSDKPIDGTLGRSPSGITYVPDENTIGIRAIVLIGTPRPEAMKGDVALEVSLNRHGGINSVTFTGNASFMSTASPGTQQIKQLASAAVAGTLTEQLSTLAQGQVYGSVKLHFDNINDVFHGNLEIFVNVAGGMVRGVNEGNKAGWAVLHFEDNNWYIHIGTPDQPLGLEVARIFKSKSYFMLGKDLPGSPPPPPQVSEILGNIDLDYMRDMNALESGMGIAFGLHFLVDTGDLRFLMFYGRFSAGTGIDFMLKDYGNEYHCAGSSGPMGINGWYANGQAYAFVMGKIGIQVNLRFYKGKYEILSIGAAAILQAKGPNPFWMKGTVGGYYRILGGLVKGKCRFDVTIGKECKPVAQQDLLEEVNLIADITPVNSATDVSVFNTPQVAFNIPVGETFVIDDMENRTHHFRAVLDEFTVMEGSRPLNGTLRWNDARDVVAFDAFDVLPGEKTLKASARLAFEEKVNGIWTRVRFRGTVVTETAETTFSTGKTPDVIPLNNVALSYPGIDQINFYPKEYSEGLIELADGQPYLFRPGAEWIQKIRLSDNTSGHFLESELTYNTATRQIRFDLPEGIANGRSYELQILNIPKEAFAIDQNVARLQTELIDDASAGSATLTTQSLEGNLDMLETKPLLSFAFRVSEYNTFTEKMKTVDLAEPIRLNVGINIFQLTSYFSGNERFDQSEVGNANHRGFIRIEAELNNNKWYERHVYPLVYEGYPILRWMTVKRPEPHKLGIPPVRDIYVENLKQSFSSGEQAPPRQPFASEYLVYNLGQSVASDFYDLQHQAVNYIANNGGNVSHRIRDLAIKPMPHLRYGRYTIKFKYVIPGIEKNTSTYEMEIFNRIPDSDN